MMGTEYTLYDAGVNVKRKKKKKGDDEEGRTQLGMVIYVRYNL